MLEFYDLGLYGFLAFIMTPLFFPLENSSLTLLASGGVFAAGFIMRPLGALAFGTIGDLWSRKTCLTLALLLMTLPTFIIGFLPTYQQIGLAAPVVLTLCRLLQGLCTGGEYNNAAIFILETIPSPQRGFYSGLMTASSIVGFFLASLTSTLSFYVFGAASSWSWRLPFLCGSLIGLVGFYLRRHLKEAVTLPPKTKASLHPWQHHTFPLLLAVGVGGLAGVLSLSLIGYLPSHLAQLPSLSRTAIFWLSNYGLFLYMIGLPLMGKLADTFGTAHLMKAAAFLTAILSYPFFWLIHSELIGLILIGISTWSLLAAMFLGPMHAYMLALFPPSFRCRGISTGFAVGVAIFGGTAPLILGFLSQTLDSLLAPSLYFILSGWAMTALLIKQPILKSSLPPPQHFPDHQA